MRKHQYPLMAVLFTAIVSAFGVAAANAQTITNGGFENWNGTTNLPSNWSFGPTGGVKPLQITGLVAESPSAALIQPGGFLFQTISPAATNFQLSMVVAATDPGPSSARSFNLTVSASGTTSINLRMIRGSSAGFLSLQAHNGAAWETLAANAFEFSVWDGATFTDLNAYDLSLNVSYGTTSSYSITYGLHGGTMTTLSNLTTFSNPINTGITSINLFGNSSASAWAIDNLSLTAVPEPRSTALLLLGVGAIAAGSCVNRRK